MEFAGYLYTYFRGNIFGEGESQHIHMSVSRDGLFWSELNGNEAVLKAELGTGGVRDPYIFRAHDGNKFYLIGTDLDANGGDWAQYGGNGSRLICIWESDDLVNWSDERLVEFGLEDSACTWAPVCIYDEENANYVVFWSTDYKGGNGKRIYYRTTTDFKTFSEAHIFKDIEENTQNIKNLGSEVIEKYITFIDSTMIKCDDTYLRFTKREQDLTILLEKSDSVMGEFTIVKNIIANETGVEGPAIYKMNDNDRYILMMDGYAGKNAGVGYFPLIADGKEALKNAEFRRLNDNEFRMPNGAKHGSIIPITEEEYNAVVAKWGIQN